METQYDSIAAFWTSVPVMLSMLALAVVMIVAVWKIFTKAGEAGWQSIIPVWRDIVMFRVAGLNPWLVLLLFVPVANLVILVLLALRLGERFGKGPLWSVVWLFLFTVVGELILGFGSAQYRRPETIS